MYVCSDLSDTFSGFYTNKCCIRHYLFILKPTLEKLTRPYFTRSWVFALSAILLFLFSISYYESECYMLTFNSHGPRQLYAWLNLSSVNRTIFHTISDKQLLKSSPFLLFTADSMRSRTNSFTITVSHNQQIS